MVRPWAHPSPPCQPTSHIYLPFALLLFTLETSPNLTQEGVKMTSGIKKFGLLLWKNYILQKRHKIQTVMELLVHKAQFLILHTSCLSSTQRIWPKILGALIFHGCARCHPRFVEFNPCESPHSILPLGCWHGKWNECPQGVRDTWLATDISSSCDNS